MTAIHRGAPTLLDRGTAAVEVAILAPFLLVVLLLVVFAGRVAEAGGNVQRAASEGAQAASQRQHPSDAVGATEAAVVANLAEAGVRCGGLDVRVDTATFHPGGRVIVDVRCRASMRDVTFLGVPGSRTFHSRAVEVIDTYRSGAP